MNSKFIIYAFIFISYVCVATYCVGIKDYDVWKDYFVYFNYYQEAASSNVLYILKNIQDPLFVLFMKPFTENVNGFNLFLFFCAFFSLSVKIFAINKATKNILMFIFLYTSYLLCLHEYVQIRIALAMTLLCCGIYICKKNSLAQKLVFIFSATIHLSVFIPIVLYYLYTIKFVNCKRILMLVPFVLVISYLITVGFLKIDRINSYLILQHQGVGDTMNIHSTLPIIQLISLIFIALNNRLSKALITYEYLMSMVGVIVFYSMISIPVISMRYFEISNLFYIIMISKLYKKSLFFIFIICIYFVVGVKNYGQLLSIHIPYLT